MAKQSHYPRSTRTKTPRKMKICSWETERNSARRPQVVVVAKAEARAVVLKARAPLPELREVLAALVAPAALVERAVLEALVEQAALVERAALEALVVLAELVAQVGGKQASVVGMTTMKMMTPVNAERQGMVGSRPDSKWPVKNRASRVPLTPQSIQICQFCTSPVTRRERS